jgi:uncharacterized membrane protein YoaK (UPF0700 family)
MARPSNIRAASSVALVLAAVAGFLDAVGYLTLRHLFTAHMTGNASKLGVLAARGDPTLVPALALAPLLFVVGIAGGTLLVDRGRAWMTLAGESLLVAVYMTVGSVVAHSVVDVDVLVAVATLALGLQTAALTHVGDETTRTTYLSGMLTRLAQGLARGAERGRLALLASLWLVYVAGAALGAYTLSGVGMPCLALPLAVLVLLTVAAFVRPPMLTGS